jgi:1-deoxy-D-xylulose-5-phosphate synthase
MFLGQAVEYKGTAMTNTLVNVPREKLLEMPVDEEMHAVAIGKGELRRAGKRVAILAFGSMLSPALGAGEALDVTVVNMRFVKPLDVELILEVAREHELLVTVEENVIQGGAGSAVAECLHAAGVNIQLLQIGLPDVFIEQGDPAVMLSECGLDAKGISASIQGKLPK